MSNIYLNQEMSKEEVAQKTIEGFKRIGTRLLVTKVDTEQRDFTNTTYDDASNYRIMESSFTTSGGLVEIKARIATFVPNTFIAQVRLLVDGKKEDEISVSARVQNEIENSLLFHDKNMPAGRHTIKIQVKTTGGTVNINTNGGVDGVSTSKLSVKETLGG